MLELYHNALSSCSQKVRLVLETKRLPWKSHVVDLLSGEQHAPEYVALNPNHVVPTLIDGERVLIESTLINEYLEDAHPEVPMRPKDPGACHAMRLFVKQIDEKVHPAAGVLTYGIATRPMVMQLPPEEREATWSQIPDPARRAARKSVIEHGVAAPEMRGAMEAFVGLLDRMQEHLARGPWISGEEFGLGDACALPYVLRLEHLTLGGLFDDGNRPQVRDWFERVQSLDAWGPAVGDLLPEPVLELFRRNTEAVQSELQALVESL